VCLFVSFRITKTAGCCREAQLRKEANIQRMAEKQKEAKLAVRTTFTTNLVCVSFCDINYCHLRLRITFIMTSAFSLFVPELVRSRIMVINWDRHCLYN